MVQHAISVNEKKPLLCKYCQKVEITFSKAKVSQSGKMIPLNIHSLEPHRCQENPYYTQQKSGEQKQQKEPINNTQTQSVTKSCEQNTVFDLLMEINHKLDLLLKK